MPIDKTKPTRALETFDDYHKAGAKLFGHRWLKENLATAEIAERGGINIQKHKLALTKIVYHFLLLERQGKHWPNCPNATDKDAVCICT